MSITKHPLITSVVFFAIMMAMTQFLAYQQFNVAKEKQKQELINEVAAAKDKFRNILSDDIVAGNAMAIIYKQNQIHNDFDSIARQIIVNSRYAEVLQLSVNGIVENAYPDARYKSTVGINISVDAVRKAEANRAAERKDIYFAGPRRLRFGDTGIIGKVPVIVNNQVKAVVAVLTRLPSIKKALRGADEDRFAYQLLKISGKDTAFFPLSNVKPAPHTEYGTIQIPEGDWLLRVGFSSNYSKEIWPYLLSVFGILFSFVAGLLCYRRLREPGRLKKIINEQTEQLAASERYFRTLVENSVNAIQVLDKDGNTIFQTRSTERITGYSLEEERKVSPEDFIHHEDLKIHNSAYQEMLDNPGKVVQRKLRLKHKKGSYIWIESSYQNLLHDENVRSIVISQFDITEKENTLEKLRKANEDLEKHTRELAISNAELEQFAYVASHDLQEPLRMVTSFMALLEKKFGNVLDDKARQYIHFATDGAKRMREIILDLLEFSRVGNTAGELEQVDINKLVTDILPLFRRKIEETKARVHFEGLPTVRTFKTPVRQVFQNLIDNSLKYQKSGVPAVINISYKESKTHFEFTVKDNGIGIGPEYFDKIFVIFQRLHNRQEYSGTGMGLAITKKIIENLGGKIWVESQEGQGSTFYFTLSKIQIAR